MNESVMFWAKLGDEIWPEKFHPVLCHLIDVGQVARRLWDDVCRKRIKEWVRARLGLPDEISTGAWLAFWVAAHDVGKICPGFQVLGDDGRTKGLKSKLPAPDWNYPVGKTPHGIVSTAIAEKAMQDASNWPAVDAKLARLIAVAIGGHHGIFPTIWDEYPSHLGNLRWKKAQLEILEEMARLFGVNDLPAPSLPKSDDQAVWMYLAGLTSVADWIGSNAEFFRPAGNPSILDAPFETNAYFEESGKKALKALDRLGWLNRADTGKNITFQNLFPHIRNPRPLQTTLEKLIENMTEPGLLIVEAPMGEGKTEAGWFAAASWDRRGGQGSYVALPTMATSNQMFGRVESFLSADGEGKKNLMLQHGKAAVNEKFDDLKYKARVYDEEKNPSAVVAEAWFAANKKHGLLAPYGVGTIDQALLAVLQTKHVFVRLFGLAGKCVILDEVHAYDAYMTTLMERLLRWLAALGCPVVLLSATLPRDKRLALLRAYAGADVQEPEHVAYPRVTSAKFDEATKAIAVQAITVPADPNRKKKTVKLGWIAEDGLIELLTSSLEDGGCAAVIRNTVGLAQETFLTLREGLKDAGITVELFHARFPFGRRMEIETDVLERYGKDGGPVERNKRVLVASQVIEQSLDLDFDRIISDMAPTDLILQRVGRLHRHDRSERPKNLAEAQLWLIEPADKQAVPNFGKSEYVYARCILLKSYILLKDRETICLPDDLECLVEQAYGIAPLSILPSRWGNALAESERILKDKQDTQQLNAMDVSINDPDQSPLGQPSLQLEDDNPEASEKIQAQTRDAGPAIQLVIVYQIDGADFLDANGIDPFEEKSIPDMNRTRRLLDNEVTISNPGCFHHYLRQPVPLGWRKRGLLRHHRIVRLQNDGTSLPTEYPLNVDAFIGLRFTTN